MNSTIDYAEQGIVGAAILDPAVFSESALKPNHFFDPRCREAWCGIGVCISRGLRVDELTVADNCGLSPSEVAFFTTRTGVPSVIEWADIIRNSWLEREVTTLNSDYEKWKSWGLTGNEMLTKMRDRLETLEAANEKKLPTLAEVAKSELDSIVSQTKLGGLATNLGIERCVPGGIPRAKCTIIFGESGNYKTTVKNNLIRGMASAGYRILDVSLEDANELTADRLLAGESGINYGKLAAGNVTEREKKKLLDSPIPAWADNVIMAGEVVPDIDEIIRVARFYKYKTGLDAVVIDYIQLLEGRGRKSEREILDGIMRKAQLAAKRDDIAYVFTSQVKQEVDMRDDHRPRVTDMLGSSAMRTHSKLSIGVYRPSLYDLEPKKNSAYHNLYHNHPEGPEIYKGLLELHLLKNVLGEPQVTIHCRVYPETGLLEPFDMKSYL